MKFYWVKLNGITLQVNAQGLEQWVGFLLDNGRVPIIDKVEEAA